MGNDFQAATGLDPADPANWQQSVDFALNQAARGGWSPWYGARAVGVTGMEGVGGAKAVGVSPQTRPATPADVGGMPGQTMPVDTPAGTAPGASVPQPPASSVPPWTPLEAKNEWWKNFKMPDLNFTPQGPPPQFSSVIPAEAPPMSLGGPLGSLSTEPPQAPGALQALAQAQEGPGPGQYYEPDPLTGKLKAGTRLRRRIL